MNNSTNPQHPKHTGLQTHRITETIIHQQELSSRDTAIIGLESSNLAALDVHHRVWLIYVINACGYLHILHRPRVWVAGVACSPAQPGHPLLEEWGHPLPLGGRGGLHGSPALLWVLGHLVRVGVEESHPHVPCGEQKAVITSAGAARQDMQTLLRSKGPYISTSI